MAAGESNEHIFLKLVLSTEGSGASLQIQRVLAGVQAVAMLNAKQPEWFPVLQAIDIRNEDQRVWGRLEYVITKCHKIYSCPARFHKVNCWQPK